MRVYKSTAVQYPRAFKVNVHAVMAQFVEVFVRMDVDPLFNDVGLCRKKIVSCGRLTIKLCTLFTDGLGTDVNYEQCE
jgi:hypothetical protein